MLTEIQLLADPRTRSTQTKPSPGILLLGCFLCTSFAIITAHIHRGDRYQGYFLLTSAVVLFIEGSIFAVDVQDFVFRYMLLNISAGLGLSVLFHRGMAILNHSSKGMPIVEKPVVLFSPNRNEKGSEAEKVVECHRS